MTNAFGVSECGSYDQGSNSPSFSGSCANWRDESNLDPSGWELFAFTQSYAGSQVTWNVYRGGLVVCSSTQSAPGGIAFVRPQFVGVCVNSVGEAAMCVWYGWHRATTWTSLRRGQDLSRRCSSYWRHSRHSEFRTSRSASFPHRETSRPLFPSPNGRRAGLAILI